MPTTSDDPRPGNDHGRVADPTATNGRWEDPAPGVHLSPRSWRPDEVRALALDGQWDFRLSPGPRTAPADILSPQLGTEGWDTMEVPGHWVLQGDGRWGHPIYTNVQFPIPLDPPFVPDDNPTADHVRRFALPDGFWQPGRDRLVLRFDGIESHALVVLNGQVVGEVTGSRLPTEFDVSEVVNPGANQLVVRVHQWSANTYVEDQDQWWLPGIFRSVTLVARPKLGIDDHWVQADFDPAFRTGTISTELVADPDAFPIRLRVPDLGVDVTWQTADDVHDVMVGEVSPWSPDSPRLYSATLSNAEDSIALRLGFRHLEIRGREWLANGTPIRFRGVNRHEFHPDHGRVHVRDDVARGLQLMKRHHVNAIRTSHYPPHPELLELCDELGFWVIDECDLETHGFGEFDWAGNPADDPAWRDNLLDRAERMVERDKNHPCVVAWSLGNESGTGRNLAAMADLIRRRDPGRAIHYEGDHDGAYTDVVSQMYTPLVAMREMSQGLGDGLTLQPGAMQRLSRRPMMLCEYGHAMGNGPGSLADYDQAFDLPGWHGGFIWEWRDHGLNRRLDDGRTVLAYGGDFGEEVHDGAFVCDGLVLADGTPSPALAELAAVNAPVRLRVDAATLRVGVENRFHALDLDVAELHWQVVCPTGTVAEGTLDLPALPPGATVDLTLPASARRPAPDQAGVDHWLQVRAWSREPFRQHQHWLAEGERLLLGQGEARLFDAGQPVRTTALGIGTRRRPLTPGTCAGDAESGSFLRLDPVTGRLLALGDVPVAACGVELWRAPTSNDSSGAFMSYEVADPETTGGMGAAAPTSAERWRRAGLDRLHARVLSVTRHEVDDVPGTVHETVVRQALLPAQGRSGAEATWQWRPVGPSAARLRLTITPIGTPTCTWPRIGLHLDLPGGYEWVRWFGAGPAQAYPDAASAALHGTWQLPVDAMWDRYAVPQESGHRADASSIVLGGSAPRLTVTRLAGPLGFSINRHDVHEVDRATHQHELVTPPELDARRRTHLYLDAAQHGLGSRACGPDVLPAHQLWPRQAVIDVLLAAEPGPDGAPPDASPR